jgi:hypothetical protein
MIVFENSAGMSAPTVLSLPVWGVSIRDKLHVTFRSI